MLTRRQVSPAVKWGARCTSRIWDTFGCRCLPYSVYVTDCQEIFVRVDDALDREGRDADAGSTGIELGPEVTVGSGRGDGDGHNEEGRARALTPEGKFPLSRTKFLLRNKELYYWKVPLEELGSFCKGTSPAWGALLGARMTHEGDATSMVSANGFLPCLSSLWGDNLGEQTAVHWLRKLCRWGSYLAYRISLQ